MWDSYSCSSFWTFVFSLFTTLLLATNLHQKTLVTNSSSGTISLSHGSSLQKAAEPPSRQFGVDQPAINIFLFRTLLWFWPSSTRFISRLSCFPFWLLSWRRLSILKWKLRCKTNILWDVRWIKRALLLSTRLVSWISKTCLFYQLSLSHHLFQIRWKSSKKRCAVRWAKWKRWSLCWQKNKESVWNHKKKKNNND